MVAVSLKKKRKEAKIIEEDIAKKNKEIEKSKKVSLTIQTFIETFESKTKSINSVIQKSTGLEQEKLNQEIADIRAELAGINVRIENYESKLLDIKKQKQEFAKVFEENKLAIKELEEETPSKSRTQKEIEQKKKNLEDLEKQRKKFYTTKSELRSLRERINDKKNLLQNFTNESEFLVKQIKSFFRDLFDRNTNEGKLNALKLSLAEKKELLEQLGKKEIELEKISGTNEYEIDKQTKLIKKISKMDVCPICKSTITSGHVETIHLETVAKIESLKKEIEN